MKPRWKKMIVIAPLAILGMIVFIWIGGVIVMYLWNWLLPELFGWNKITFWQAIGLLALCRILFGGWHSGRSCRSRMRHRTTESCDDLTSEEHKGFRQRMRERWGGESKPEPKQL